MFWTSYGTQGTLSRAWMDGSNAAVLKTGLSMPLGIAIDFQDSCLYWAEYASNKLQSSDFHGQNVKTILELPDGSNPVGIGVLGRRIYWTEMGKKRLQSSTKSGKDIRLLHEGTDWLHRLAVVPRSDVPMSGNNDCENRNCSKVCVLTPTSYRCLS